MSAAARLDRVSFRHPRYRVVRLIGEGGMGKVFLARDLLEDGRPVALKLYPARTGDTRLRTEFLALRDLHHPAIARALNFGVSETDGAPFFTLEYVVGAPLDAYLRRLGAAKPHLELPTALWLFTAVTAAVAYLHRRGMLHLDIKPQNILVVDAGGDLPPRPVLIDFGLVQLPASERVRVGHGTIPLMPPEFFRDEPATFASDIYSLAATFYRVLSGRYPVAGTTFHAVARAHRERAATPLPEVPAEVEKLLLRALAKDPRRRFQDAGELHRALLRPAFRAHLGDLASAQPVIFHEPDFVGRARELAKFTQWLDGDRRGSPILEVSAGGGWGKTRFLEKAVSAIEVAGQKVIFLRCSEEGGTPLPARCLKAADLLAPAEARARGARTKAATLSDPELLARRALARLPPLLERDTFLAIDDVHLAGDAATRILEQLAQALRGSAEPPAGGIIVTRKTQEGPAAARAGWKDARLVAGIEIGPLTLKDALQIDLEGLDGCLAGVSRDKARRLKTQLHARVGGQPLFYVRGLLDLAGDRDRAVLIAPTERILEQVRGLEEVPRLAAACMACLDRSTTAAEVGRILGVGRKTVAGAVRRLRYGGLVSASDGRVRLIHESARDAVLEATDPARLRDLHRRAAKAMLQSRKETEPSEAAWHLLEAGDVSEALQLAAEWIDRGLPVTVAGGAKAVDLLLRAARASDRASPAARKFDEAAAEVFERLGHFEDSLAILRRLAGPPPGAAGPLTQERVRLLRKAASACHRTARVKQALAYLHACVGPGARKAAPGESIQARVELAGIHHFRGEFDRAIEHCRRGIDTWKKSPRALHRETLPSAVHLHAILGQIHIRRLEFPAAVSVLREGLRLAERSRSAPDIAVLLNNLALAHHLAGQFDLALGIFRRAQAVAVQTEDLGALASIRSNIAQIHAKKGRFRSAREMLDETEESPAVKQSRRMQLGCLYTRGLLLNLMRADADDVWTAVQRLAEEAEDHFLRRLAGVYMAEGRIARGELETARPLLASSTAERRREPVVAALKTARRSLLEALCGRGARARALRMELAGSPVDIPEQLRAWNRYYAGYSAMETLDEQEARTELEAARQCFHKMGFTVGRLECTLLLADLHLRAAMQDAGRAAAAQRELRLARKLSVEGLGPSSAGSRELRITLLEARLLVVRAVPCFTEGRKRRRAASTRAAAPEALSDLLARAAGDPALARDLRLRRDVEMLRAASEVLSGDRAAAHAAARKAHALDEELTGRRKRSARKSPAGESGWVASGLAPLRPPPPGTALAAAHASALARLLGGAEPAGDAAGKPTCLDRILEETLRATRADVGEIFSGKESVARSAGAQPRSVRDRTPLRLLVSSARPGTSPPLLVCIGSHSPGSFSDADALLLEAAARLAAYALSATRAAAAEAAAAPGGAREATETRSLAATASLSATRKIAGRSRRAAASEFLREAGLVPTRSFQRLIQSLEGCAATDLPVLISGESGTGKNVAARLVHLLSDRSDGPFLVQNASAIPAELFEADLFGYESGAFTGAERTRTGFLFRAEGGTFHLEEIGDLAPSVQQLLLKVVEEKSVRPIGAAGPRSLDVRFVASTHRDMDAMVRGGQFRADLFYRLNAARVHLPPLREQRADIPLLARHLWSRLTGSAHELPRGVLDVLANHDWPGNIRELASVLRRLGLETEGVPTPRQVRELLGAARESTLLPPAIFEKCSYQEAKRSFEEAYLLHLFQENSGNLETIASELGTTTRSVYRRFERLGLKPRDLRE